MDNEILTTNQLLFEENINLTGFKEYGFKMSDLIAGKPVPSEGARFDISFEGDVTGEKVNGRIVGIDYLEVRADGRFFLTLQATITTNDGVNIKVEEKGSNTNGDLKLFMKFHTTDEKYSWLNHQNVVGTGFVNLESGEAKVNGYLI